MAPSSDGTSGPRAMPELELDVRPSAPRPPPKSEPAADVAIELAIDPRTLLKERAASPNPAAVPIATPIVTVPDVPSDARLLADHGAPPRHWFLSPLYAWRVLKRLRELKAALAGRRAEAVRAAEQVEDALVAFSERAREHAERSPSYEGAVHELRRAEQLLRSRDQVLASEQDAHKARLAQVDGRLASLEAELAQTQNEERATAAELATHQEALAREDARLKRAETEVRAAQQRAGGTETGG